MKKVIAAIGMMITGAVFLSAAMNAAAAVSAGMTEWWSNLGKFLSAVVDNMLILVIFAAGVLLAAVGAVLALRAAYGRGARREEAPRPKFEDFSQPVRRGVPRRELESFVPSHKEATRFEELTLEIEKPEVPEEGEPEEPAYGETEENGG
jgi:hypothetical protein